jgi:hypothetical protein
MNPVAPWLHERALRNHNPGDLRPRDEAPDWPGQDDVDNGTGGPFAAFQTHSEGWAALGLWCLDCRYLRGLRTALAIVEVFAPPMQADTAGYAQGVAAKVGNGDLDLSSGDTLRVLCQSIVEWEQWHPVWTPVVITAGMRLCTASWPAYRAARLAATAPAQAPAAP